MENCYFILVLYTHKISLYTLLHPRTRSSHSSPTPTFLVYAIHYPLLPLILCSHNPSPFRIPLILSFSLSWVHYAIFSRPRNPLITYLPLPHRCFSLSPLSSLSSALGTCFTTIQFFPYISPSPHLYPPLSAEQLESKQMEEERWVREKPYTCTGIIDQEK